MASGDSDCPVLSNSEDEFEHDENSDEDSYAFEDTEIIEKFEDFDTNDDDSEAYTVISVKKIAREMEDCISEVSSVINIPKTVTRILLNHFKWDKEKLMEKYYDGDQEKLFADARVASPFVAKDVFKNESESNECKVCFSNIVDTSAMTSLQCGHKFCLDCWDQYLTTKITSEGQSCSISCAAYDCEVLVDDDTVRNLLKNPGDKAKYQRLITNSFVESNKLFRWCPYPGCSNVIKATSCGKKLIRCKCDHVFCFECGENWHEPVDCDHLRKWIKKCNDDSETMRWILVNSKNCPRCDSCIEKNGGCNRIVCQRCKYQFCWICMQDWSVHGYENPCNTFVKSAETKEKSRAALERYVFYCNRYVSHQQSLKLERQMYGAVEARMSEIVKERGFSWYEVAYLKRAVDTLQSCRQTLSYTYVFAYYVERNNQSLIFEDNQNDLHRAVEDLSGYLKNDMENESIEDAKRKILTDCLYCENRRNILVEHVQEGNEKNWWTFETE